MINISDPVWLPTHSPIPTAAAVAGTAPRLLVAVTQLSIELMRLTNG